MLLGSIILIWIVVGLLGAKLQAALLRLDLYPRPMTYGELLLCVLLVPLTLVTVLFSCIVERRGPFKFLDYPVKWL